MKIVKTYPHLIGGVSQQSPSLRDFGQCEAQENAVSSITEGLKKRGNSEFIANLAGWPSVSVGEVKSHFIDRDSTERYLMAIGDQSQNGDSTVKIYDYADGSLNTIRDYAGNAAVGADFTYLDCVDPSTDIKLLTVKDYTFVVNNQITPALTSDTTAVRRFEALYVVEAGNYATDYVMHVTAAGIDCKIVFKTNDATAVGNQNYIDTGYIATALAANLTGVSAVSNAADGAAVTLTGTYLTVADWTITVEGSVIHIMRSNTWVAANSEALADFNLKAHDGVNSSYTTAIKDTVQTFLELPTIAKNGFIVKVDGDPESAAGDYYVMFVTNDETDFDEGIWQESIPQQTTYKIDPTTMPHLLIRLSSGEFLFTPANAVSYSFGGVDTVVVPSWTDREVGDDLSNPEPSFIGEPIQDIFYFKDRLGFLASDATILSSAGDYFTFWRTTVVDLLDSERIDVQSAHTRVTNLKNAVPLGEQLIIFSDRTQFSLRGENLLTPKTVAITPVSEHESYTYTPPIAVGSNIYMPSSRGDYSVVRQLVDVSQNRPKFELIDVMAYIPSYIQGNILALEASKTEDMIVALADGDLSSLYVYSFFINGGERVQNSWSKFTFNGDIIHVSFVDNNMVLVIKKDAEYSFETIDMQPFALDTGSSYKTLLDRRVAETDCTAVYDAPSNSTLITVPYTIPTGAELKVVKTNGAVLIPTATTATSATVTGDHSATTFWAGETYEMLYEFSPIEIKTTGINQGLQTIRAGKFWASWGHLEYQDSGYFNIEVTIQNQTASNYEYTGYTVGAFGSAIGSITLQDGVYDIGLLGPAKDITVRLKNNSHFPCRMISFEIEGKLRSRGQRL